MERTKYEKKYWYPNMREAETLIWERFLAQYPDEFEEVAYNVKVGEGMEMPEGISEEIAFDGKVLTQQKIDVVGFKGDEVWIIEIKAGLNIGGPGQLWKYEKLYKKTYVPNDNIRLLLLTDNTSRDLENVIEGENIKVVFV